jgi:hypothetical protein
MPVRAIAPCLRRFGPQNRIGEVADKVPLSTPSGRRDRLTRDVGRDGSGSNPLECSQIPEKSGMGAALCFPLLAGPTAGVKPLPQA